MAITKNIYHGTKRLGSVPYTIINETVGAMGEPQLKLSFQSCSCVKPGALPAFSEEWDSLSKKSGRSSLKLFFLWSDAVIDRVYGAVSPEENIGTMSRKRGSIYGTSTSSSCTASKHWKLQLFFERLEGGRGQWGINWFPTQKIILLSDTVYSSETSARQYLTARFFHHFNAMHPCFQKT